MATIIEWYEDVRKRRKIRKEASRLWFFPENNFGYMQIRKVGSTSIANALMKTGNLHREGESLADFKNRCSVSVTPAQARKLTSGSLVFAFVRHPLARLYSAYVNKIVEADKHGGHNPFRCHGIHLGIDFERFVEQVCELDDRECDRHLRSQSWFLADSEGLVPSFIGKLETFEEDWNKLREALPILGAVDHMNRAAHGMNYIDHYNSGMIRLAQARYESDFKLFGYDLL